MQKSYRKLFNKTHEEDFELLKYFNSKPGDVFVDIGANRGAAIQSILLKKPNVKVVAFEPNKLLVEKIDREFCGDSRVRIFNYGLGSARSSSPLYVPFYNNYMFDGLASFKRENAESWLKTRLYFFREEKLEVRELRCEVERLDDFNLPAKFIKIDVQGFEYEVLQGAINTLKHYRPVILMEAPKEKELEVLTTLSYQPFIYRNGRLISSTKNYNVFFIPNEKVHEFALTLHLTQ